MKLILTARVRQKNIAVHSTIGRERRWQKVQFCQNVNNTCLVNHFCPGHLRKNHSHSLLKHTFQQWTFWFSSLSHNINSPDVSVFTGPHLDTGLVRDWHWLSWLMSPGCWVRCGITGNGGTLTISAGEVTPTPHCHLTRSGAGWDQCHGKLQRLMRGRISVKQ